MSAYLEETRQRLAALTEGIPYPGTVEVSDDEIVALQQRGYIPKEAAVELAKTLHVEVAKAVGAEISGAGEPDVSGIWFDKSIGDLVDKELAEVEALKHTPVPKRTPHAMVTMTMWVPLNQARDYDRRDRLVRFARGLFDPDVLEISPIPADEPDDPDRLRD